MMKATIKLILEVSTYCMLMLGMYVGSSQQISTEYRTIAQGSGGFVTGLDIHPTGAPMLCRTDVGGAYRWSNREDKWINIVTQQSLKDYELGFFEYDGVASIVSAPSDGNRLYMAFVDRLFYSDDQGDNWKVGATSKGAIHMEPNARAGRLQGERLAVDPNNKDVVYYGSNKDGLLVSNNGGKNWTVLNGVPVGAPEPIGRGRNDFPGIGTIVFDKSSGTNGQGSTKRIYVSVWGEGIFRTDNAGNSWSKMADYTKVEDAEIADDGTYLVCEEKNKKVYLFKNGNWSELTPPFESFFREVLINPTDSQQMVLFNRNGFIDNDSPRSFITNDGGATWKKIFPKNLSTRNDIPYLNTIESSSFAEFAWDPNRERIWMANGVGVWYFDNYNDPAQEGLTWNSQSRGISELIVNKIVVPEAGKPLIGNWDRASIKMEDLDTFPNNYGPTPEFNAAWDFAVFPGNTDIVYGIFEAQDNNKHTAVKYSGYSEDAGRTWTPFRFDTFPFNTEATSGDAKRNVYGNIMVSSKDKNKLIWCTEKLAKWDADPSKRVPGKFLYSPNRGADWYDVNSPEPGESWNDHYYFYKSVLAADPVDGNVFYAYNHTSNKLYRSTDYGQNFTYQSTLPNESDTSCKLRTHPSNGGHLFFTPGFSAYQNSDRNMGPLQESTDGGASWTEVNGTEKVIDISFGAPKPGTTSMTWYVYGKVNGEYGVHRSLNEGETFVKVGELYPFGITKGRAIFTADPYIYGQFYIGSAGAGTWVGTTNDADGETETDTILTAGTTALSFDAKGGEQQVSITSNIDWTLFDNRGFMRVSPKNGSGNGTITVTAEPNLGKGDRSGSIFISGDGVRREIKVSQSGASAGGGENGTLRLAPKDDAYVRFGNYTDTNFGEEDKLVVRDASVWSRESYLKFDVGKLPGTIENAKLRLYVNRNSGNNTMTVAQINDHSWSETTITAKNAPAAGSVVGTFTPKKIAAYIDVDVTAAIEASKGRFVSLKISGENGKWLEYGSKEGDKGPVLILKTVGNTAAVVSNVEVSDEKAPLLYPNPSKGVFKIEGLNEGEILTIETFSGVRVYETKIANTKGEEIDASHLPAGVYLVQARNSGTAFKLIISK